MIVLGLINYLCSEKEKRRTCCWKWPLRFRRDIVYKHHLKLNHIKNVSVQVRLTWTYSGMRTPPKLPSPHPSGSPSSWSSTVERRGSSSVSSKPSTTPRTTTTSTWTRWDLLSSGVVRCNESFRLPCRLELIFLSLVCPLPEVQLPPQGGSVSGQSVLQRPGDPLEDVHHLGRGQPVDYVPTQHGGPSQNGWLVLGLLYQPQRCRLPNQVRDRVSHRTKRGSILDIDFAFLLQAVWHWWQCIYESCMCVWVGSVPVDLSQERRTEYDQTASTWIRSRWLWPHKTKVFSFPGMCDYNM